MAEKQGEQPKIPGTPCSISLYEQALEMFEPKACVARAVVVFDPRHILVPETSVRHGALLSGASATHRHASSIRPVTQTIVRWITCVSNFMETRFRVGVCWSLGWRVRADETGGSSYRAPLRKIHKVRGLHLQVETHSSVSHSISASAASGRINRHSPVAQSIRKNSPGIGSSAGDSGAAATISLRGRSGRLLIHI